jgi:outer membrane protein assembly factor BamA
VCGLIVLVLGWWHVFALAASYRIDEIRIEGTRNVDPERVRKALQVQTGQDLSQGEVQLVVREDVKRAAQVPGVKDVLVTTEPLAEGIRLIFDGFQITAIERAAGLPETKNTSMCGCV